MNSRDAFFLLVFACSVVRPGFFFFSFSPLERAYFGVCLS
jgi:hypothetical protein